mmetsp:Transcript_8682/g.8802  ORF Transcript_8682/g.8802 Transcript_8682/m.8802 type:complete len:377 (+) Transcript_8682:218-1348(+)
MEASKPFTIYIRGISKQVSRCDLVTLFESCGPIKSIDFCESPRKGFGWITYENKSSLEKAILTLNHTELNGRTLTIKEELGINNITGKHITTQSSQIIRKISKHSVKKQKNEHPSRCNIPSVSYTGQGLLVDGMEYPIPQGKYLMQLLHTSQKNQSTSQSSLISILTNNQHGNKQAKEISESMAMTEAVIKLGELTHLNWSRTMANVFVLADGKTPYTSAALALFLPSFWHFWSIDPLLEVDTVDLGEYISRIHLIPTVSQSFYLPGSVAHTAERVMDHNTSLDNSSNNHSITNNTSSSDEFVPPAVPPPHINIIIACHSHAPLQEFWNRVKSPKCCVSMPCCGRDWSVLNDEPILVYDDYEVFSPKRKIYLYASL